jgi:hypothetical protein
MYSFLFFDHNIWNHWEFRSDACLFWRRYTLNTSHCVLIVIVNGEQCQYFMMKKPVTVFVSLELFFFYFNLIFLIFNFKPWSIDLETFIYMYTILSQIAMPRTLWCRIFISNAIILINKKEKWKKNYNEKLIFIFRSKPWPMGCHNIQWVNSTRGYLKYLE